MLRKRDTRSAIGWVGIIWLVPILGVVLVRAVGHQSRATASHDAPPRPVAAWVAIGLASRSIGQLEVPEAAHLTHLRPHGRRTDRPALLEGNEVMPLVNGDEAYPEMLRAIGEAKKTVTLAVYIFDNDRAGKMFAEALAEAVKRGVDVRVLVDDVGARYSWPSIEHVLRAGGGPHGPLPADVHCPAGWPMPICATTARSWWSTDTRGLPAG